MLLATETKPAKPPRVKKSRKYCFLHYNACTLQYELYINDGADQGEPQWIETGNGWTKRFATPDDATSYARTILHRNRILPSTR
jgi:hypothetical protein